MNDIPFRIHAIENMGMGQVCKLFLEWSEPWWAPNEGGIQLAWPSNYNNLTRNESKTTDYERHWYRSLCNFTEVDSHPNILVTWLVGEAAKVVDKLDEEEVIRLPLKSKGKNFVFFFNTGFALCI